MAAEFEQYIKQLQAVAFDQMTEHPSPNALENLLNALAGNEIAILQETKRKTGFGAPGFTISNPKGIIGYIETKKTGENLEKGLQSEKNSTNSVLRGLFKTFQENIFNQLAPKKFAVAFAQMLSYGLFLAKLNADTKQVNLHNAKQFIPASFELIKKLVNFLDELNKPHYKPIK